MTQETSGWSREQFQAVLDDWAAAITANDATRIDAFVEPDWVLVGPEGGPTSRETFLGVVASGELTHSDMTFEVLAARTYGTAPSSWPTASTTGTGRALRSAPTNG